MIFRNEHILDIFRELPGHRGCTDDELNTSEQQLSVQLPKCYREMMKLDSQRLVNAGIVAPLHQLQMKRQNAIDILVEDNHTFQLAPHDVVFAWEDTFAFYFFTADGNPDPPVMMFNYYSSDMDWKATTADDRLTDYFISRIRQYLKLT